MSNLDIDTGDLDLETRMNPGCCILFPICRYSGDCDKCCNPVELMNALGLVFEYNDGGTVLMTPLHIPDFYLYSDGGSVWRLHTPDQREYFESAEILIETLLK